MLSLYRRLAGRPFGRRLFSLAVSWKAPYFRTIRPVFVELSPGRGEVRARNRRAVHNHIGTFHAIACCNLAAGTTMEATLPGTHRWIPKGMSVGYLAKAESSSWPDVVTTCVVRLPAALLFQGIRAGRVRPQTRIQLAAAVGAVLDCGLPTSAGHYC